MSYSIPDILLVGSVPLTSSEEAFKTAVQALPNCLERIPDGETGLRQNFIGFQHPVFPINVLQARWGGQAPARKIELNYKVSDLKPTGYDSFAIESYKVFQRLQEEDGIIPSNVRFQVCFPSPLGVVRGFVESDYCEEIEPLYEARLLEAVRKVQDSIPASKLAIQWDLPFEVGMLESERGSFSDPYHAPFFPSVKRGILERLTRLALAVDEDVELGFHLCYGDMGHVHFVQPEDTAVLVDLATLMMEKISPIHLVKYIHVPVPEDRIHKAYFNPLKNLRLDNTKLYLGLVHPNDEAGTKKRIKVAKAALPTPFGVATECGLGRTPKEELSSVLAICKNVTQHDDGTDKQLPQDLVT